MRKAHSWIGRLCFATFAFLILNSNAHAGAIYIGAMPFSTTTERVPAAFSGIGFSASYYLYPGVGDIGYGLTFFDQGSAAVALARFRYYVSGAGPRVKSDQTGSIPMDRVRPVAVQSDPWQLYFDAGPAFYAASNTVYRLGTEILYGMAGYASGGIDVRFLGLYFYGEIGYLQSFSNALSSAITQVGLVFPVPF